MPNRLNAGRHLFAMFATLSAAALVLGACGDMNDDSPREVTATVSFGDYGGDGESTGLISGPASPNEPVVSMVVGAVVITYRSTPVQNEEIADMPQSEKDELTDDALQSAAYLTIIDLPFTDDVVSFLIPPAGSGNWQLVGAGTRSNIDVLQDLEDDDDAATWFGFTESFQNGIINPGDEVSLELSPACSLDSPPVPPCPQPQ